MKENMDTKKETDLMYTIAEDTSIKDPIFNHSAGKTCDAIGLSKEQFHKCLRSGRKLHMIIGSNDYSKPSELVEIIYSEWKDLPEIGKAFILQMIVVDVIENMAKHIPAETKKELKEVYEKHVKDDNPSTKEMMDKLLLDLPSIISGKKSLKN